MMMDLALAASHGQAPTTVAKSQSSAAHSAAPLNNASGLSDDLAVASSPTSFRSDTMRFSQSLGGPFSMVSRLLPFGLAE